MKTVAGESWLKNYCEKLDDSLIIEIEIYPSTNYFIFGDGKKVLSFPKVIFPVQIVNNKSCRISCETVKENIPLLVSKQSMKRVEAIINMQKDKSFKTHKNPFRPETLKYWVGLQRGQSYLMVRRCLFSLGWPPF